MVNSNQFFRVRVKICGITSVADAQAAIAAGADAIGLVFYARSPRALTAIEAQKIVAGFPPFVSTVGLFVNAEKEFIERILRDVPLDILQFHGTESEYFCQQFQRRYIKAVPMRALSAKQAQEYMQQFPSAVGFLLDAFDNTQQGGSGKIFDWLHMPESNQPIVLAGGLTPENVGLAIRTCHPFAVDVSSGVESAPGKKSFDKMRRFMQCVREVGI